MRRLAAALILCLLALPARAQTQPSAFPMATLPLSGVGNDAVLLDQCQAGMVNCVTKQAPSVRVGAPVQQTTQPSTPFAYQHWIDTSQSPPQEKIRIGSTWYLLGTLDPSNGYQFNVLASGVAGLGTMATQNANAVAITGGSITGLPTPSASSDAATKGYVDNAATGIVPETAVKYATAAILPNTPTYNNGAAGVGAKLTAGANTTLTVDGNVVNLNERVLVKDQADPTQNGCYSLTTAGGGVPWVLTRCTDWDAPAELKTNSYFLALAGTANPGSGWTLTTAQPISVGSTALIFSQFSASAAYTSGTGLQLIGSVFSIANTGVAAATYGSASQVPVFAVNAQGDLTSVTNTSIAIGIGAVSAAAYTQGSIPYANGANFAQDNANLFWDSTNHRLGIGTASPQSTIHLSSAGAIGALFNQTNAANIGLQVNKPLGVVGSSPTIRAWGYSPSIEVIDKDSVQNWYFGLNDNDANALYIGAGYGPNQGITPAIRVDAITGAIGMPAAVSAGSLTLGTPLAIGSGGTADTGTAWTTYSPSLTCSGGGSVALNATTGRHKTLGKTVFWEFETNLINGKGTCAGELLISLPVTAVGANTALFGSRRSDNQAVIVRIDSGATAAQLNYYNGVAIPAGALLTPDIAGGGVYESN